MVEVAKLTTESTHLKVVVERSASDIKELRNWLIGAVVVLGGAGIGAVIWANGRFEQNQDDLHKLNTSVAVMQVQMSAMHDDIKDIKSVVVKSPQPKPQFVCTILNSLNSFWGQYIKS